MDALADRLMRGPRGRRLLLELLKSEDDRAREAIYFASRDFSDNTASFGWAVEGSGNWEPPRVTATQAADALAGVTATPPDSSGLLRALRETVDGAMYWQEPDAEEVLAARGELDEALAGMAQVVAGSPAAAWLDAPLDREHQHRVRWPGTERRFGGPSTWLSSAPPATVLAQWGTTVREEEATALRERPANPRANVSGPWWSIPPLPLVSTTRALPEAGPVGLHLVEDSLGEGDALTIRVGVPHDASVLEIACAQDWARLCARYPLDVTASRRHDWFRCTGRHGSWVIPDWQRVAAEYDGVHLTAAGYLEASRVPIPVADSRASVIAGWNPDATIWLRDVTRTQYPEEEWVRPDDGEWARDRRSRP